MQNEITLEKKALLKRSEFIFLEDKVEIWLSPFAVTTKEYIEDHSTKDLTDNINKAKAQF